MKAQKATFNKIIGVAQFIGIYFISFVLIAFATSKFFGAQFQIYHYSSHIPLKDISLQTHAWSFFGRSFNYNLFIGIAEFLAGSFILFNRTRLIGLLMSLAIYTNILVIDIEFNVKDALDHVIVEFVIILLLLIPYAKDLWKFFWNMAGKFELNETKSKPIFTIYIPILFLMIVTGGFLWETSTAIKNQPKIIGEYKVDHIILNSDTTHLKGGKYTKEPMLFFEFGNTFILSINDSTYWGDYFIHRDSIRMVFDKQVLNFKEINASLNSDKGNILGRTNTQVPITIGFSSQ